MKISLVQTLPRPHRAMLAASAAIASGTSARLVTNVEARTACLAGAIACGTYALNAIYFDARKRLVDSTFFELIEESFGRHRAQLCIRAILFDHLATTTVTTAVAAYQLPRPILAAGVSILLMLCLWRASLVPFASRDWRAATIVRTTAISGLLMMTWCGSRCLFTRRRMPQRWFALFPRFLGMLGGLVMLRHRMRRRRLANTLVIVSLYSLLLVSLGCITLAHPSPMRLARLGLEVIVVVTGLLIVFFDLDPQSSYRMEFVNALLSRVRTSTPRRGRKNGVLKYPLRRRL